jgi:hypothetical protein
VLAKAPAGFREAFLTILMEELAETRPATSKEEPSASSGSGIAISTGSNDDGNNDR